MPAGPGFCQSEQDNSEVRQQCISLPSGCSWSCRTTQFSSFPSPHPAPFHQGLLLLPPPFPSVPPEPVASLAGQMLISITVMRSLGEEYTQQRCQGQDAKDSQSPTQAHHAPPCSVISKCTTRLCSVTQEIKLERKKKAPQTSLQN